MASDEARIKATTIDRARQQVIANKVKRAPASIEIGANKPEKKSATKNKKIKNANKPEKKAETKNKKRKNETESKPKRAYTKRARDEKNVVAPKVVKSLKEQVNELIVLSHKKHCDVDATDHIFRGKEKVITLLREAHKEINHVSIDSMEQLFKDKVKEMKARIDQKRIAVMKKVDLACRTDGKVDTDSTTNFLQQALLLLGEDTPVLEQSVAQLLSTNPRNKQDAGDQSQEISLTSLDVSCNKGYKLASRIAQDDGDELEIYEQCNVQIK